MSEVGTWELQQEEPFLDNPAFLAITYTANGVTRTYENIPAIRSWVRRSDSIDLCWSVFMVPLVREYPGDLRPYY